MITEKITFNFESEAQQKRFHKELERRDLGCMSAFAEGWKARAEAVPLLCVTDRVTELELQLDKYRRLYNMFGKDDMTDAKFAEAFERVVLADNI
jgi:hypothetical protein